MASSAAPSTSLSNLCRGIRAAGKLVRWWPICAFDSGCRWGQTASPWGSRCSRSACKARRSGWTPTTTSLVSGFCDSTCRTDSCRASGPLLGIDWAALRSEGPAYVEAADWRYSLRADQVMKTDRGIAARWDREHEVRSVVSVWGGRPFDAAVSSGEYVYLFADDHYCTLSKRDAQDDVGGAVALKNVQAALARSVPIRGGLSNLPGALMEGIDSALEAKGAQYVFKDSRFVRLPAGSVRDAVAFKYELVRLTTSTAAQLNRALFVGGVRQLLSLSTQQVDETPGFSTSTSTPTIIRVNPERVDPDTLPLDGQLDFGSANGIYLWEIFFHAPFLIAEMLSTAQRFEEARAWHEHIFDPTEPTDAWKFLPFLTVDVERIAIQIRDRLDRLATAKVDVVGLRDALAPEDCGASHHGFGVSGRSRPRSRRGERAGWDGAAAGCGRGAAREPQAASGT